MPVHSSHGHRHPEILWYVQAPAPPAKDWRSSSPGGSSPPVPPQPWGSCLLRVAGPYAICGERRRRRRAAGCSMPASDAVPLSTVALLSLHPGWHSWHLIRAGVLNRGPPALSHFSACQGPAHTPTARKQRIDSDRSQDAEYPAIPPLFRAPRITSAWKPPPVCRGDVPLVSVARLPVPCLREVARKEAGWSRIRAPPLPFGYLRKINPAPTGTDRSSRSRLQAALWDARFYGMQKSSQARNE
ncbi:hypothetical protein NDU88_001830 [Pleurodeles waltl]|uniref:Uncharacterized protein n=1 Tax=Pleurodeles waltl TaxID=8319 RepID=A0AAV7UAK6_PLEWA|nr:hypothetical protein NDU88_001830 [Pleurodeles waltl]